MVLKYEVFYTKRAGVTRGAPQGLDHLKWVPLSSVLIYGEKGDAVLVDTPLLKDGTQELLDWVVKSGKNIKYIYTTHPHGDHYFGNGAILEKFPGAKAIAMKEAVDRMTEELHTEATEPFWGKLFPGQLPENLVGCEVLEGDEFEVEGEKFVAVPTGHTDTNHTSTLWVPSIGLAVTGDAVYNNVHPYMGENKTKELRDQWLAALDKIEALKPKFVVGGHKDPEQSDDPKCIGETRQYFADLERLSGETGTVQELYDRMLEIHPKRVNPGSLWGAANVMKGGETISAQKK